MFFGTPNVHNTSLRELHEFVNKHNECISLECQDQLRCWFDQNGSVVTPTIITHRSSSKKSRAIP